jgi:hypothetical protein
LILELPMKKLIIFISASFALIFGFWIYDSLIKPNLFDDELVLQLDEKLKSDKDLSKYFSNFSLSKQNDPPTTYKEYKVYSYDVLSNGNEKFMNLSDKQKRNELGKVAEAIKTITEDSLIKCGEETLCSISEILVFDLNGKTGESDSFSITYDFYKAPTEYEMEVSFYDENSKFQTRTVSANESNVLSTYKENNKKPNLEIVEKSGNIDGKYIYITGALKNNSDKTYSFIEVKVTYMDDNGNVLDTETTYVNSSDALLPNERKSFKLMTEMIGGVYSKYKVEVYDYNVGY